MCLNAVFFIDCAEFLLDSISRSNYSEMPNKLLGSNKHVGTKKIMKITKRVRVRGRVSR